MAKRGKVTRDPKRKQWLDSMEGQADLTRLWLDGVTQRYIAKSLGYKNSALVCQAIMKFCRTFCPDQLIYVASRDEWFPPYDSRKECARLALSRYEERI